MHCNLRQLCQVHFFPHQPLPGGHCPCATVVGTTLLRTDATGATLGLAACGMIAAHELFICII